MTEDLWARALAHALHDHRDLAPDEAARVSYEPHGAPMAAGPDETVVQLQQTFAGIPILRAVRSVRFRRRAEASVTGRPVPVAVDGLPEATVPAREAAYAVSRRVAEEAGVEVSNRRPLEHAVFAHPDRPTVLRKVGFRDPITARLRLLPAAGALTLVWEVHLELEDDPRPWSALVSASGRVPEILELASLASHVVMGPVHDLSPPGVPSVRAFPPDRRAFPGLDGLPLPPGPWVASDRTAGNNAVVVGDRGETFAATAGFGGDPVFAPVDPLGLEQAAVNAFYLCNYLHDFFHLLGFDEAKGNFQERNTAGAGAGRDAVRVFVFSRRKASFAFFVNRLDGREPELVLRPGPGGHAGLDADVVIHEYTHGVTDRIVGRGRTERPFREPQSVALAEGISDYFALTLQNHQRRRRQPPLDPEWTFGKWISGHDGGLRRSPYGPGFTGTYGTLKDPGYASHHDAGQVWCQTLLELNEALGEGAPDLGDERGWRVVLDAACMLHPGPDGPHFLHARDAVYAALAGRIGSWAVDPAALTLAVRAVFAARGMGDDSRSPGAAYGAIVEAF